MKNLKKILIALAVVALLVSSVAIIVGATDVDYTGTVSELQDKFDAVNPNASTANQSNKLADVYAYMASSPVDPEAEGFAALNKQIQDTSVKIGNALYESIAKASTAEAKLKALNLLYGHLEMCPPDATVSPDATTLIANADAANVAIVTEYYNSVMASEDAKANRNAILAVLEQIAAHPVDAELTEKIDEATDATLVQLYDAYMAMPKTHVDADQDGVCDNSACKKTFEAIDKAASVEYIARYNEIGLCYHFIYVTGKVSENTDAVNNIKKAKADMEAEVAAKQAALDAQANFDDYDLTGYHVFKDYEPGSPDANQTLFQGYNQTAQGYTTHETDIYGNRYQAMVYGSDGTHNYIAPNHGTKFTNGLVIEFDVKVNETFQFFQYQAHHSSVGLYNIFRFYCANRDGNIQLKNEPSRTAVTGVKQVTIENAIVPEVWARVTVTYDNETRLGKLYLNYEHVFDLEYSPEWQYNMTRIGTNFTNQHVAFDNFSMFEGSEYRIYDKFDVMDEDEQFCYFVDYMLNPENPSLSRNSAYNKAKNLYYNMSMYPETAEWVEKFDNCDYEADIKLPAMAENIGILRGLVDELLAIGVTSATIADINKAITGIDDFIKTNSELINKGDTSEGGYQDQMLKVNVVRENLVRIENITAFVNALTKFDRAVGYDALLKHALTARSIYEAAEYDIAENVEFVMNDPVVATFEALINGEEILPEDENYVTLFEYYETIDFTILERQLYENSKRIVSCIDIVTSLEGYENTVEFWEANADKISGYTDIVRAILVDGSYAPDYEGLDEAIETFQTLNVYFYEYIQKQHIETLRAALDKYATTESYIDKMGICDDIAVYLATNDLADVNQDVLSADVYAVVADEIDTLRQLRIEYNVYVDEIAAQAEDYEAILEQNTQYFIGTVQQMSTCIYYADIKPLYDKATTYYYGINVDDAAALAAAEVYAMYRELIAYYEATAEIFIGYVTSLNAANDPTLTVLEKEDAIFVALTNSMAYASLVDEGVAGVAEAMATYEAALTDYNAETEIVNSEISGTTQITCATRTGYISTTVLAIISKLFEN